jgi:hypothetical protein
MAVKRWSQLSERSRRVILVVGAADGLLKIAALIDIKRRPAAEIRGPKWAWATVVTLVNSVGLVPTVYFLFGRRRSP